MTTRAPTDRRPRRAPDRLTVRTRGLAVTLGRGRLRLRLARVKRPGVQAPGAPLPDRAQLGQVFRQGRSPGTFHRGGGWRSPQLSLQALGNALSPCAVAWLLDAMSPVG